MCTWAEPAPWGLHRHDNAGTRGKHLHPRGDVSRQKAACTSPHPRGQRTSLCPTCPPSRLPMDWLFLISEL